jgi:hypothetical protein
MEAMFERDLARSIEIQLGRFKRRSMLARIKEGTARVVKGQL